MVLSPIMCQVRRWAVRGGIVLGLLMLSTAGWVPTRAVTLPPDDNRRELAAYLSRIVQTLAGDIGTRNYLAPARLDAARLFIAQEFAALGYEVYFQTYSLQGQPFSNVVARKAAAGAGAPLVVGAHYDSCFNPGADDNASGVAGLLGLARLLADDPAAARIVFVAFVNEEPPFFRTPAMGSWAFAWQWRKSGRPLRGAVVLEMLGCYSEEWFSQRYLPGLGPFFPNKGNFIAMVGNVASARFKERLAASFRRNSSFPLRTLTAPGFLPRINFSDHWAFWREGYPAVMVTDTAFLRNGHYHRRTDLPATLNYQYLAQVVLGLRDGLRTF